MIAEPVCFTTSSSASSQFEEESPIQNENPEEHPFQNISIEGPISQTKFPVYLISSLSNSQYYAMKMFPYYQGKPSQFYYNESRFNVLCHENIISPIHIENENEYVLDGQVTKISYVIMEYAPYGNLFRLIKNNYQFFDEKLIRTFFQQLIEGIGYLHKNGAAHLDIKPENLLLGDDYVLKIADFDTSFIDGDHKLMAKGTKYKRAPELVNKSCKDPFAADIFSVGITLFLMKSGGKVPQAEDTDYKGLNLYNLMQNDNTKFWEFHCKMQKRDPSFFGQSFRQLFNWMTREDPSKRPSVEQIKESEWYNGPTYDQEEVKEIMGKFDFSYSQIE
mmetsp:Transcript_16480/g.14223  ORF Transcript_16480/g.14223 Transcript_16480/m.14223 type:complete len:333 (-) Transcript_16480:56-1054(-)|eukprot:CAMPEP_0114586768 /NCGR_PEP_ID=MMETSP0125-20121206/9902_1 /TAXON_ID=485358 ORGANISM="Aristerostoma sp., Strain ATCC 50986" /NCGR_SAMPLE_ID=MMETSP0125 /ASSEMBLY_ACC=CAM_ASM_000245 /LENGTH=332 /DNA_ID=CAMNT_0001782357 /DNA_START=66 /DNA_END=1064 /DNA_ORIENTATION=+